MRSSVILFGHLNKACPDFHTSNNKKDRKAFAKFLRLQNINSGEYFLKPEITPRCESFFSVSQGRLYFAIIIDGV